MSPRTLLAASAAALASVALAAPAHAAVGFALTDTAEPRLASFDTGTPGQLLAAPKLIGLGAGEVVRGMDLRPANGLIYALTTDGANTARLRTVDPASGATALVATLAADPADLTNPYTSLDASGGAGVDFNPVPDRLRVTTAAGADLRVNPASGLTTTDANLNPGTPQVVGSAYTNSFAGSLTTTLYDIDLAGNSLMIQNPPNNGTLVPVGAGLGIAPDSAQDLGFDISPNGNAAFLVARVGGTTRLYGVDLTAGTATPVGVVGDGATPVRAFALAENVVRASPDVVLSPEGGGTATVTVQRLAPRLGARVDYATIDGGARAGVDYDARSGTLAFAPGETTKTISIPLHDDGAVEPVKLFGVALSNVVADAGTTAILPTPVATVVLADDDGIIAPPTPGSGTGSGGGSAPPLAPDRVKPVLLATAGQIRRGGLKRSGLRVRFSCSEACSVTARLLAGRRTVAAKDARLAGAALGTLTLKPSRAGFRGVGRRRSLKVALTARDAAGNATSYAFVVPLG
jgi:hypothetical protein